MSRLTDMIVGARVDYSFGTHGFIQYMLSLCIWKCILINQRNLKIYIFRYVSVFEIRVHSRFWYTTLYDKVCQWLATGLWFSLGPLVSSTSKTDRHDITELLLKVALKPSNKQKQNIKSFLKRLFGIYSILCQFTYNMQNIPFYIGHKN